MGCCFAGGRDLHALNRYQFGNRLHIRKQFQRFLPTAQQHLLPGLSGVDRRSKYVAYALFPFRTYAAVLSESPNNFVGGMLQLSSGRSRKVQVLTAVTTVPSRSSRYICGFCRSVPLWKRNVA